MASLTGGRGVLERIAWSEQLPAVIQELQRRWSLLLGRPWSSEATCSWVAPAIWRDGTRVVLKIGMPHMEAEHEIAGLRFWDGDPTVRLLEADETCNALLLERCEPGSSLRELAEADQDVVVAELLQRLWRPPAPASFRPLSLMIASWMDETRAAHAEWPDADLVHAGLRAFEELSTTTSTDQVLLATDLHAGNVLRARREPWLVIDPKPFVGDPAYDATQHLLNCRERMSAAPVDTIRRFAGLLDVDDQRLRRWMFARSAAEPREPWTDDSLALARALA